MPTIVKALALAELGIHVFPVNTAGDTKVPLTPRGHLDATTDPDRITAWWDEFPEASPGVAAGPSGLVLLDVDAKNGKDGWQSLMEAWVDIPDTLNYDTPTGGVHYVYESDRDDLNGVANYRKMDGVDRRAGSSFFVWWGDVPDGRDVFTQAPEWLLDPARRRTERAFEGDTADWFESLTPGEPNVLVRRAMERVTEDMSHSEMVERQYEAVRLGAEGNPGVPQLLDAIQDAWLNRPPENHTTPESQWQYKFFEALDSGIAKYGELIGLVKSLPEFTPGMIPPGVSDSLIYGSPANKQVWNRAMRELITAESDDLIVVSILWSAPRPRDLSREWGLSFVMDRVTTERERMEAPDDVPVAAEPVEPGEGVQLLNEEEREAVARTQTFTDLYLAAGMRPGVANPTMCRASAWNVLSLAFAFKGFIPVSQTDKLGLNLWIVSPSYPGTGKTRSVKFEDEILNALYEGDNTDQPYQLGDQVSPAGLHEALLMRNRQGTYMNSDEASGFISRVENVEFMRGLKDDLAKYYDGYVPAATKKNAKHLKGESALTHFNMHLHATPERFWEIVTREMFLSGFLARVNWSIGELPDRDLSKVSLTQVEDVPDDIGQLHPNVAEIVTDLGLLRLARGASTPVLTSSEALDRMTTALRTMLGAVIGTPHEDMLEPAVTRLGFETIRKCATLNALWRGPNRVEHIDALVAIHAAQEWFDNLFTVAEQVSDSLFEKSCAEIEAFIRSKGGATRTQIFSRFKGTVQRTSREIDERLDMLRESGRIYRTERGGAVAYEVH